MGVPGSDPFEKDVFPVKFVPSLQGFPRRKTLRQHLGAGQSGGGGGVGGGRVYFTKVKVLHVGRSRSYLFFRVPPATCVGENEKHEGSSGQKQLFESPHKVPNTVGKNVLENYGMQIICGANPLQIHFLKCSQSPGPTRMKNRSDYTGAQRKATKKGNRILEVARKQSAAFRKVKKPSITHTRYIIIRRSTPSPRVTARGQTLTRKTRHSFMLPSQSALPDSEDCSIWKILDDPWPPGDSYL